MFYRDDSSVTDCVVGTLFFAGLNFLSYWNGRQTAFKEVEEQQQKEKIARLEEQVNQMNRRPPPLPKRQGDGWNDLRKKLNLPLSS